MLLVEDNELNQQVALELLERPGIEVESPRTASAVVQRAQENAYDLRADGLQMPVMDGLEATRRIRAAARAATPADPRDDRERDGRRPRAVARGRHERPRHETHRPGGAVQCAASLAARPG